MSLIGKNVTVLFPGATLLQNNLPADLARYVTEYYRQKGVQVLAGDSFTLISRAQKRFLVQTKNQRQLWADGIVAGSCGMFGSSWTRPEL